MNKINLFNEYLFKLRSLSLREPFIEISDGINPLLKHYMKLVDDISFKHGSYHTYYGDIKRIVNSFTKHWTDIMDEAIKETDKYIYFIRKEDLVAMIDKTIHLEKERQDTFIKKFHATDNLVDKGKLNEIQDLYINYMKKIYVLKEEVIKLNKQEKIEAFVKEHLTESLQRKNEIFTFTYDFISLKLILALDRIRISLEEILKRLRNNLKNIQDKAEGSVSELLLQLYEKNKENLILSRQDIRSSIEAAEVKRGMDIIIDKIEHSKNIPENRLDEEYEHWNKLLEEFRQIENTLKKLQKKENSLLDQKMASKEDKQKNLEDQCCPLEGQLEHVRELKLKAAKALFTFFSVRGEDCIYYTDKIGTYYVDDYGHQVYVFGYGLDVYHVDCQGNFLDQKEEVEYYYDDNGRYVIEDGQKIYQIAPCTSKYQIENDVFTKLTKDCGHSEKANVNCLMQIKDPNDITLLPESNPVDIKGSLDSETVKYLWDSFGHILPEAMHEVAEMKPKNPIHCLAHKLLQYKPMRSQELNEKRKEAALYRQKIYQDRIEKVDAMYQSWREKQAHVKPEWDDAHGMRAHLEAQELVEGLNYYN